MGTRSRIVLDQTKDNTTFNIISMYCHYDGYMEYTGKMLLEHYNDKRSVQNLLVLTEGYASALKATVEETIEESVNHEDLMFHDSVYDFMLDHENSDLEFIYLFRDGEWYVSKRNFIKCDDRFFGEHYYYWTKFVKLADQKEVQPTHHLEAVS